MAWQAVQVSKQTKNKQTQSIIRKTNKIIVKKSKQIKILYIYTSGEARYYLKNGSSPLNGIVIDGPEVPAGHFIIKSF